MSEVGFFPKAKKLVISLEEAEVEHLLVSLDFITTLLRGKIHEAIKLLEWPRQRALRYRLSTSKEDSKRYEEALLTACHSLHHLLFPQSAEEEAKAQGRPETFFERMPTILAEIWTQIDEAEDRLEGDPPTSKGKGS